MSQVEVLGGVKSDPLNPSRRWAVPPSPPEVITLGITRIPTIIVYTLDGKEVSTLQELRFELYFKKKGDTAIVKVRRQEPEDAQTIKELMSPTPQDMRHDPTERVRVRMRFDVR
jgi:S1-C subfamily serine protease